MTIPEEKADEIDTQIEQKAGEVEEAIEVTIGPRFLNLFSKQLYSSQNKAFEELVANSWDAGAKNVYLKVPDQLEEDDAAVWVLDDGQSMDLEGLKLLWNVANSNKRDREDEFERTQIGKFGIGKLATYVLANELTYICKDEEGQIRYVTMSYKLIDEQVENDRLHVDDVSLEVRHVEMDEVEEILKGIRTGEEAYQLITDEIPEPEDIPEETLSEYGDAPEQEIEEKDTWTLAILTSLKEKGRNLQTGWIRRILQSALPLGKSINISLNGECIKPSKADVPLLDKWEIGNEEWLESEEDIAIDEIEVRDSNDDIIESRDIEFHEEPYPHIKIEDIPGEITGEVKLYEDGISGGKSENIASSNGFFINILGRVVNQKDPYFGLDDLKKAVWTRLRVTIRADWLDEYLRVNREDVGENIEVRLFRNLLRTIFNRARNRYEDIQRSNWPDVGEIVTDKRESLPLKPLESFARTRLDQAHRFTELLNFDEETEIDELESEYEEILDEDSSSLMRSVEFTDELLREEPIVKYDLNSQKVLVNYNHPYVLEYTRDHKSQKYIRDFSTIELLTELHMVDSGISPTQLKNINQYRDQLFRTFAHLERKNAIQIASILVEVDDNEDALEEIVSDALEYLGYAVRRLHNRDDDSGVIDSVATAKLPSKPNQGEYSRPMAEYEEEEDEEQDRRTDEHVELSYKVACDAKSTTKEKVQTGNIEMGNLVRLSDNVGPEDSGGCDYILVVGKDFQVADKLLEGCENHGITPIRTRDLAQLVLLSATYGALDLLKIEPLFRLRNPDEVEDWVEEFKEELENEPRNITHDIVLKALDEIDFESCNAISADRIASVIKNELSEVEPREHEVMNAFRGLELLVPSLVRINESESKIYVNNDTEKIRDAIMNQMNEIPEQYQTSIESELS